MAYSSIVKPSDYFGTLLYTGNNTNDRDITGLNFTPDFTWIKPRDYSGNHGLFDAVRGADKSIRSNQTRVEDTSPANKDLDSFISGGIRVDQSNYIDTNSDGISAVAWNWKANGQGSSNTDGSINTTYTSVNTTAGFSISSYTGTGSNATVGHGLGSIPKMIIVKNRDNTTGWGVYHASLGNTKYLQLNDTAAEGTASTFWNNTTPTNQVFSIGTSGWMNNSGEKYIAYCFADKKGYSKFGSYIGNGNADGAFVYTGFKPAFLIYKKAVQTGSAGRWSIIDNKRDPSNVASHGLAANASSAENTGSNYWDVDLLSNGFKFRTTEHETNGNGETFIYMAFAEEPLVANSGNDGVPATAR